MKFTCGIHDWRRAGDTISCTKCQAVVSLKTERQKGDEVVIRYVLGFMFSNDDGSVLLIRKLRPLFQAGKLNGLGGHVEDDETPAEALVREFKEECGIQTDADDWKHQITLEGNDWCVLVFSAHGDIDSAQSTTDEEVVRVPILDIQHQNVLPNLLWMLPLCQWFEYDEPIVAKEAA